MNLKGKLAVNKKKTAVFILTAVVAAGIIFYAGAQYEKNKLTSLGLAKSASSANTGAKKGSAKKQKTNSSTDNSAPSNASDSSQTGGNLQNSTDNSSKNSN